MILPDAFLQRRHMPADAEYWLDEREGDLILHPRVPDVRKVSVEPTTASNLHCRTCIRNVWDEPEAHMPMSTFERLLEGMAALPSLKRVVFAGFGEPLGHPHIVETVEAVRKRDVAAGVGSNGLLLDARVARELVCLGVDRVVISVDGVKPETYAGVRGAMLSQVLSNVRSLNEAKSQANTSAPALGIEFVVLRNNVGELSQLAALASQLNASRVLVSNVLPYTEEMRSEMQYGYEPRSPFNADTWPIRAGEFVL